MLKNYKKIKSFSFLSDTLKNFAYGFEERLCFGKIKKFLSIFQIKKFAYYYFQVAIKLYVFFHSQMNVTRVLI